MNIVRKHLSAIKGGRLAAAAFPARLVTLVISDVPGDDPVVIASGPTVADSSTFAEAHAVLEKYRITEPRSAIEHLMRAADEPPKRGDPRLANTSTVIIATPQLSLEAAASVARKNGITPLILGDALEAEAREVGRVMARIARQAALRGQPPRRPSSYCLGVKPPSLSRGLKREDAAFYVGVSPATFDQMVQDGRMPKPKRVGKRTIWDRRQLDISFEVLPDQNDGSDWDQAISRVKNETPT